jgi:hypothetical protein
MPRRTGTSCLLSVLIVGLVGFALYRPDPPGPPQPATGSPIITAEPDPAPVARASPPEPTPGVPWSDPPPRERLASAPPPPGSPGVRATAALVSARVPSRPGFTTVRDGERLADIARRLYGDEARAEPLWQANRDQLPDLGSPLRAGMLLRTP